MFVGPLGKQNLGPQRLEAVATAETVHDPDQVVQAFRVGVRHWMIEVAEYPWRPVIPGTHQIGKGRRDFWRNSGFPIEVTALCLVWRLRIVDAEEILFEPVG